MRLKCSQNITQHIIWLKLIIIINISIIYFGLKVYQQCTVRDLTHANRHIPFFNYFELSSNKFQQWHDRLARIKPSMGYSRKIAFKVKFAIIKTRTFHKGSKTDLPVLIQNIYSLTISCLKGITLFCHISLKDAMHLSLEL